MKKYTKITSKNTEAWLNMIELAKKISGVKIKKHIFFNKTTIYIPNHQENVSTKNSGKQFFIEGSFGMSGVIYK